MGERPEGILAVFGAGVGCFDEHSGVVLAFFVVGQECFDERSEGFWQFLEQVCSASMSVLVGCWRCLEQEWV